MSKGTTLLVSTPDNQRQHVLGILEGLSDGQLRRPVLPSRWTCLGMVRHLTLSVERFSFREIVAGESFDPADPDLDADAAWRIPVEMSAEAVFGRTAAKIAAAKRDHHRDFPRRHRATWPDDIWPTWKLHDLREIVLHVITETACHAGHLGHATRELIDGRLWIS